MLFQKIEVHGNTDDSGRTCTIVWFNGENWAVKNSFPLAVNSIIGLVHRLNDPIEGTKRAGNCLVRFQHVRHYVTRFGLGMRFNRKLWTSSCYIIARGWVEPGQKSITHLLNVLFLSGEAPNGTAAGIQQVDPVPVNRGLIDEVAIYCHSLFSHYRPFPLCTQSLSD